MVHLLHNVIVIYKIEMFPNRLHSFFSVHPRKLQEGGKIINSQEVLGNLQLFNKITFGQQTQNGRTSDSNSNSNIFMAKTRKLLKAKGLSVLWPSQPTLSTHFGAPFPPHYFAFGPMCLLCRIESHKGPPAHRQIHMQIK